jgi:adenine-specific DNA-methyltransferase
MEPLESEVRYEADAAELPRVAEHGVVYTRPWVVDLVLDLAGYDPGEDLVSSVAVEPSCGNGEFLEAMIRRLSSSCRQQGRSIKDCEGSLLAFDLDPEAIATSRQRAESILLDCGWSKDEVREMARRWIREADFLLDPELDMIGLGGGVDFVVGNPPYVRLEHMDQGVAETYRKRYETMIGRADLYVGFFERALGMLAPGGVCAFICADRWMLNQYGSRLRKFITTGGFSVEAVVEMHRANAFHDEVLAYPAITILRRTEEQSKVFVARVDRASVTSAGELAAVARRVRVDSQADTNPGAGLPAVRGSEYVVVDEWFKGSEPWPSASPERLSLLKHLEAEFPPLENPSTGTRVGIGIATGADKVFLTKNPNLVEEDRLLPMAMAKDTMMGVLEWSGNYLVNPWSSDGSLVDLGHYPRLRRYFEQNEETLKQRHVASKTPSRWYRTIDKVDHALATKPKLLIPDIKSVAHPVYDEGQYYPHHNLYHITSEGWDLKVLGGILLSRVCQFFIECYAVRMNNGYLRFQAQYLRRIRVPRLAELDARLAQELAEAFERRDVEAATRAALRSYGIDEIPS